MTPAQEKPLAGQVALITGASSGVGWHTALRFAALGASVVLVARRAERLRELCGLIGASGAGEAVDCAGDAAREETAQRAVGLALGRFGRLDIVICNAGQGNYKQLADTSPAEYDELMDSNMRASFCFARFAVPHFLAERRGTLLFVSSVAGLNGVANEAVYCAAKFAQVGFAQALDAELRPHGIKVGVLCPGGIKTEFALGRGRTEEAVAASSMMLPEEVADAIVYACTLPANVRIPQMVVRNMGGTMIR